MFGRNDYCDSNIYGIFSALGIIHVHTFAGFQIPMAVHKT